MKKIIFTFILIITFSSNAFSDHFYKNWGVVVDIKPIYYNQVINKPRQVINVNIAKTVPNIIPSLDVIIIAIFYLT